MDVNRWLRMVAGAFVLASLALGYWASPKWYLFTAFVGLNLFQCFRAVLRLDYSQPLMTH